MRYLAVALMYIAYLALLALLIWRYSPWFILVGLLWHPHIKLEGKENNG